MKKNPEKNTNEKDNRFPVVAIGASAGGIGAMNELLGSLPADTGMCFIYIQHLDPDHESKLSEIFTRSTKMPVREVTDKMLIEPEHVYIIPPNKDLTIENGSLQLSTRPKRPERHLPINSFFSSLAENYKEKAIGVLLSGNPPDGTLGLKAIKSAGGITFAQDASAQFNGMPKNAIAENAVDLVLSPKRIAEELVKLSIEQERYETSVAGLSEETISNSDEHLVSIFRQIHGLTGVDFSQYKSNTIKRRIIRRMIIQKIESLQEYALYLKHHTNEVNQLYQDLLINVTSFFRDPEAMDCLRKNIIPKIIRFKTPSEPIRIWVPACSTGQEAYSLAIILMEVLGERAASTNVQIFATDLSELAINKARLGIYSKDELSEIPQRRLDRFFTKIDGSYRIIKSIRDLCVYATHNVLKDPPFSRLDIISCSNLLIYLEPVLQKKLMATFHYALNSMGYLVLGKSETIGSSGNLFSQVDKKNKIFLKKKDTAAKALFELNYPSDSRKEEGFGKKVFIATKNKSGELDLDQMVDQTLLKKYTPACVVVNHDLDIIQFRGSTGLFLEPAPGRASLNLLKMARPGLGFELRNIVSRATKSNEAEGKSWVESVEGNKTRKLSIEAVPLKHDADNTERYFLVVFDEEYLQVAETQKSLNKDRRVKQLEAELSQLREDMRTIVEEQEAANEELQSVNEEIISSNEELQSINEELETSKEELESSNEELITINQELQMRNEQLAEIQEYAEAVFTTIRESLLILDKNLRVKNANSTFYKTFQVTEEETEGKLVYDLGNKQWNIPKLKELLEDIIPRNSQMSEFEVGHRFQHIGEKIMVLNARRLVRKFHNEHLILLAIEDITHHRHAQKLIEEREEWFRHMADNSPMMVWVADTERKMQFVNKAFLEFRNVSMDEVIGKSWIEDMHVQDKKQVKKIMEDAFAMKKEFSVQYRFKKSGKEVLLLSKGKPDFSHEGNFKGFIGSCMEIPNTDVKE